MAIRSSGNTILHQFVPPILLVDDLLEGQILVFDEDAGAFVNGFPTSGPGSGEANTASNVGVGEDIFLQKVLFDLQFKGLIGGQNITLTPTSTDIIISTPDAPNIQGLNVGVGNGEVFKQKVSDTLEFRTLQGDGNHITLIQTTDEITVEHDGDADTFTGLAVDEFLLTDNNLSDLENPETARLNLSVLGETDANARYLRQDISTVPTGDLTVSLGTNVRRFANIFAQTFHGTATTAIRALNLDGFLPDEFFRTATSAGTGVSLFQDSTSPDMVLKSLRAGTNVTITENLGEIIISSDGGTTDPPTEAIPVETRCELHTITTSISELTIGFLGGAATDFGLVSDTLDDTSEDNGGVDEIIVDTEDYGGVDEPDTITENYGNLDEPIDSATDDYGAVNDSITEMADYGLVTETTTAPIQTIAEEALWVSINGIKQLAGSYTVTDNKVTFSNPLSAGSIVELLGIFLTPIQRETVTGDGTTKVFNLAFQPANKASLFISINGVKQHSGSYGLTGNVVTLAEAPDAGDTIEFLGLTELPAKFDTGAGDGVQTEFLLNFVPVDECSVIVTVNGVKQHSDTYTVNANVLTFSEAPNLNDEIEFIGLIPSEADIVSKLVTRQNGVQIVDDTVSLNFQGPVSVVNDGNGQATININALSSLQDDTSPRLGGNLVVDNFGIITTTNKNINLTPNGTGNVNLNGDTNVAGNLAFEQGLTINRVGINTDYNMQESDYLIAVEDTTTVINITLLPAVNVNVGASIVIKDESGGAGVNNIQVIPDSGETIDGQSSLSISTNFGVLRLYSNGSSWFSI